MKEKREVFSGTSFLEVHILQKRKMKSIILSLMYRSILCTFHYLTAYVKKQIIQGNKIDKKHIQRQHLESKQY